MKIFIVWLMLMLITVIHDDFLDENPTIGCIVISLIFLTAFQAITYISEVIKNAIK